ncbi:SWI5-dependent HO expression protein 3-like [Xenia sp. Carnegie-2017]|uniref:SWI5-dependent HO expression protein 3-like n=1 Tax=Xenia sp. Carnegie-2017 TaxID=2897299 RepID=UPI001F03EB66|nr:SWI5-dependent HO expression protein 3-like [Xenia sp. Carnegie-2017]
MENIERRVYGLVDNVGNLKKEVFNVKFKTDLNNSVPEIQKMYELLDEQSSEIKELLKEIVQGEKKFNARIDELTTSNNELKAENKEIRQNVKDIQRQYNELKADNDQLKAENNKLTQRLENMQKQINDLSADNEKLNAKINLTLAGNEKIKREQFIQTF